MQEMLSLLPRAKAASVSFLAAFSGSCTDQQTWCILAITEDRLCALRQCKSTSLGTANMQEELASSHPLAIRAQSDPPYPHPISMLLGP